MKSFVFAIFIAILSITNATSWAYAAADAQYLSLSGGAKLAVIEDETVPVINMRFTFEGAGAASDIAGARGLAHFTAQMLMQGAGDLDSKAFHDMLAAHAIHFNAYVDDDHLTIAVETLSTHAPVALQLVQKIFTAPRFDATDMERIRTEILANLKRLNEQPGYKAARLLAQHIFHNHPYQNPVYGVAEEVNTITAEQMRRFMQSYITRGNLLVAAAGDISANGLSEALKNVIAPLPRNDTGPNPVARADIANLHDGQILHATMPVPQTVIRFSLPWIGRDDGRFYAAYLLQNVLGGQGLSSVLMQDLRGGEDGLVYHISTHLDLRRGANTLVGYAATSNDKVDAVIERITARLAYIKTHGLSAEQCEDGKTYLLGNLPLNLDNTAAMAETLRFMQLYDLPQDYIDQRAAYFSAVRCKQVAEIAGQLLDSDTLTFATVGGNASPDIIH